MPITRFDHLGVTVADLDAAVRFFADLGLEPDGRTVVEGDFIDTVIGIHDSCSEIVMMRAPGGGAGVELARFVRPASTPGDAADAPATREGMRSIGFEVEGLQPMLDRLAEQGYGLVGGVGEYEGIWRMAHVRGPEGLVVSLSERIG